MRTYPPARRSLYIAIAFALAAAGASADSTKAPIQIGAIHNLTGSFGSIGVPSLAGAMLAIQQLNEHGGLLGRPVELVVRDGQSDPAVRIVGTTPTLASLIRPAEGAFAMSDRRTNLTNNSGSVRNSSGGEAIDVTRIDARERETWCIHVGF